MAKGMLFKTGGSLLCLLLAGCASLPDVTYTYYLRKYQTTVTVTQTVQCNPEKTGLVVFNTPSIVTSYPADYSKGIPIQIKKLDSTFGDSDFTLSLTDDGRLDSVDQSTTGEAAGIVKSTISLALAGAAIGGSTGSVADYSKECKFISDTAGEGKALSLTYKIDIPDRPAPPANAVFPDIGQKNAFATVKPTPDYQVYHDRLTHLGSLQVMVLDVADLAPTATVPVTAASKKDDHVDLWLQKMKSVQLQLSYEGKAFGTSTVMIPGDPYAVAIPVGQLFGTQKFKLKLADSGAVTMIDFGKTGGDSGALDSATGVLTAATPKATADQVSDLKSQADLIAQQQRLARCQNSPTTCQ